MPTLYYIAVQIQDPEQYGRWLNFLCPEERSLPNFHASLFNENNPQQNGTFAFHLKIAKVTYHTTLDKS